MNVVVYANCQGIGISKLLPRLSGSFATHKIQHFENYKLIRNPTNFDALVSATQSSDLFIYQPVGAGYGVLSTDGNEESILKHVPSNAMCVSFPYIYNLGPWPLYLEGDGVSNAESIVRYFDAGESIDWVLNAYRNGGLCFNIQQRMLESLQTLHLREKTTDIKVANYIEKNILSREIFFTQNHPSTEVFLFVLLQILNMVGQSYSDSESLECITLTLGSNLSELPGRYPIDRYCIEEAKVTYVSQPDPNANIFYEDLIRFIHRKWLNSEYASIEPSI